MEIPIDLQNELLEYCNINKIEDVKAFTLKMLKQGLTIEKYGSRPAQPNLEPKIIEKIVEVPVEKIIKVSDDEKLNEVLKENVKLNDEINKLNNELIEIKRKKDIYGE
jgi:hypothetical protein